MSRSTLVLNHNVAPWLFALLVLTGSALGAESQDVASQQARKSPDWLTRGVIYQVWLRTFTPEGTLKAAAKRLPKMAGITWWNLADGTAYGDENKSLGGLLDKDMNPKPAYHALDKLINHEWKTRIEGTTDPKGRFAFRGFKGGYRVTVQTSRGIQQFQTDVGSGDSPHKLRLAETKD